MLTTWREKLLRAAEKRLPALTRYRRSEPLPIALHSRRVYILPTRFGLGFSVLLCAMLLGALNFNNNPALLLTALVAAISLIGFHHCVAQLNGLQLRAVSAAPVFAGHEAQLRLLFTRDRGPRARLYLDQEGSAAVSFDMPELDTSVAIAQAAPKRGWQPVGRFRVWTDLPFGMTYAWSNLHPEHAILVYPGPEQDAPPMPTGDPNQQGQRLRSPGEDWHGLREFRNGDPPRHIAWRASARQERLLLKEFADPASEAALFDYAQIALAHEARISRLTRWVLDAEASGTPFRLRLPSGELGPDGGPEFAARCLRELALLP